MTEEQLTALLRLKRHEQPPPEYFARLLQDIHRRQRTELLRQPLWRIAVERMHTFFSEHSMGHVSYAGAMAVALVAGVAVIRLMTPGSVGLMTPGSAGLTGITSIRHAGMGTASVAASSPSGDKLLQLQKSSLPTLEPQPLQIPQPAMAGREPRYVIDARPVSYEPSSSFNF